MKKKWITSVASVPTVLTFLVLAVQQPVLLAQQAVQADSTQADTTQAQAQADTIVQPIAFPHNIHAGQYGLDCQYCHYSAERSVDAGMPPVGTCMGCHAVIPGTNNPQEVAKIRQYYQDGETIPWVRVYKLPDHVHFPHMRHINAGVQCQTCHGQVQDMGVVEETNQPLAMGWCVSCHKERGVTHDCSVCHY